ncbi:MAG: hypothetical protein U0599_13675 [Vicinamibacteria bacterium]
MRTLVPHALAAAAVAAVTTAAADPVRLQPGAMKKIGEVDARYQSYNVEMVEVTGGRFWAPYGSGSAAPEPPTAGSGAPGLDPRLFRKRTPIDLASPRLQTLAAGLGPAYVRVSGTWANSTYFHDSDDPAPAAPPAGFGGVLTRAQWKGVVDFARATDAKLVTSFAISGGVRDAGGAWTPVEMKKLLAYTASIGGAVVAAELFNEPNVAAMGGAPRGYDAAAYGRDFQAFLPAVRAAAPKLLVLGPGSVGEGGLMSGFPGAIRSEDLLAAAGPGLDAYSYHFYGAVSKRCAAMGAAGQTTEDAALSEEWLARTEREARFHGPRRDRFAPGKPLWVTETGEAACGGNPWASTFTDTFRYVEQLGRLAKLGVQVVMHNTLAASDYALVDEETLEPRPSYWAALLWRRLMGTTVLEGAAPPDAGVHVYAHCLAGRPGGVALLAVNTDRTGGREIVLPARSERYTLTSSKGLDSHTVELNGRTLALATDAPLPALAGAAEKAGPVALPAASVTFLAVPEARNPVCR